MAKNRYKQVKKVFSISLGPGDRAFEPHYSDQNPSEILGFRGIFLFLAYCGAGGEGLFIRCPYCTHGGTFDIYKNILLLFRQSAV